MKIFSFEKLILVLGILFVIIEMVILELYYCLKFTKGKIFYRKDDKEEIFTVQKLPEKFISWQLEQRVDTLKKMRDGDSPGSFGPHLPILTTKNISEENFPTNSASKGVGFSPKEERIRYWIDRFKNLIENAQETGNEETFEDRLNALIQYYSQPTELNFTCLGSIEIYNLRTGRNIRSDPRINLCYLGISQGIHSYMINAICEIHLPGSLFYQLQEALHDLFHLPRESKWGKFPFAYQFHVIEVWDKSPGRNAGKLIV